MSLSKRQQIRRICAATLVLMLVMGAAVSAAGAKTKVPTDRLVAADGGFVASATNGYLDIQVGPDGIFNSGATGDVTGSQFGISYSWPDAPWSSQTTLRVDGADSYYGSDGGAFTQAPTDITPTANQSVWRSGDIEVTQRLEIVTGTSTGRADTGMYRYTLKNLGSTAHTVGLRVMIDTYLGDNDACPFRIPGTGSVSTEMNFVGSAIPEYWQAFRDLSDLNVMAQGTLKGGSATVPDRFAITRWSGVYEVPWDYEVTPGLETGDSAVLMYWNPVTIPAGQSRQITTYYGLGTVSGTTNPTLTGPTSLTTINGAWSPNPFTVTAYLSNGTASALQNTPITLSLPAGLEFAPGESATHLIANIPAGQTGLASWSVSAVSAGDFTYSVSALGNSASRDVSVPEITGADTTNAYIDSATPQTSVFGAPVTFTGHGTDALGHDITAWEWSEGATVLSSSPSFATSTLSAGDHTISFRVRCSNGTWSAKVNTSVAVDLTTALIDSVTPQPSVFGAPVTFTGHGTDALGHGITAWEWSKGATVLSSSPSFTTRTFSVGDHTISFRVRCSNGTWSAKVNRVATVKIAPAWITRPSVSGRASAKRGTKLVGSLGPARSTSVRLTVKRYSRGRYRAYKTLRLTSKSNGTWSIKYKLKRGTYKIQASATGSSVYANAYSGWRKVKVK